MVARLRIDFGITHCRSSACSGSIQPPDLPWYFTSELHWLKPTAQSRATCRAEHIMSLVSSEALAAPFRVYLTVGPAKGRREVGSATTRCESRNTGNRTIAPMSKLTRARPPEMQVTSG